MFFLFLSFLSIKIEHIWSTMRNSAGAILILTALKLLALPAMVYYLFELFWPEYALAALLLSGVSTGVVAPFVANLVNANSPLVLVLVVITSPLLPFTLPLLVKVLVGQSINISLDAMIRMLSMVIFVPIVAVEVLRRISPKLTQFILDKRFPISLIFFSMINLGVFSKYSAFFRQNPAILLQATLVALVLGGIYLLAGVLPLWRLPLDDQIAGGVIMADINNVLVIVFASQFFGPIEPTVAAMYMLPFFLVIVPLRFYRLWRRNHV
jgi:BASS family bile acid:Na+ symporter